MAAKKGKPEDESAKGQAKVMVGGRVRPDVAEYLETLAEELSERAKPGRVTVSQIVEEAVTEYVDRHRKRRAAKNN